MLLSSECHVLLNLPPVSDSDSLFLEDVDEETNFVQMAVTTLTKHNLLLIEKLQSAKVSLIRDIVKKAIIETFELVTIFVSKIQTI